MRLFLFICFIAMSAFVHGQKKLKVTVDQSSGDTIFSTSDVRLYVKAGGPRAVADYLKSSVYRIRDRYIIDFAIQTGRSNNVTVPAGAIATIDMINGNSVTLYSTGDHRSKVSSLDYGCYLFAFFRLTAADIRALQSSPIKFISIGSSAGNLEYEIKGKFSETISGQISRVMKVE